MEDIHRFNTKGVRILRPTKEYRMNFLGIYTRLSDRTMIVNCSLVDEPEIELELEIESSEEQETLNKFLL